MSMKLSSDKEHFVLENRRLVYYLVKKMGVTQNSSDFEDIVSIGTIGLIKAAITFDTSKNIAFSTYASRCIKNEIFLHYRKAGKYANDLSIDAPIVDNGDGTELTLLDTIADPDSDFVEKIVDKEESIAAVRTVLNCLEGKQRIVLLYRMADFSQMEIAKKLNLSQAQVSRILTKAIQKVQEIENQQMRYEEVFSIGIVGNKYRISFLSKEISKSNKIFANFLQNLTSIEKLSDFDVNCNNERIIFQLPGDLNSFALIAQIIQVIDDFIMSSVSSNIMVHVDDTGAQSIEIANINEENEFDDYLLTEKDIVDETILKSIAEREMWLKQVRDYMLSINSFTVDDLKIHFPNITVTIIKKALNLAKIEGLIKVTSRGKYVVNKN